MPSKNTLTAEEQFNISGKLRARFEQNTYRHPEITWLEVQSKLESNSEKLWSISQMVLTEGEPDVVGIDSASGNFLFFECLKESPKQRRSVSFDRKAQLERKKYPSENNAEDMAKELGIEILDESQYRHLQNLEKFDTKTSSWIKTPKKVRQLGGALFGDYRYEMVFIFHNGADSYYGAKGFRVFLML